MNNLLRVTCRVSNIRALLAPQVRNAMATLNQYERQVTRSIWSTSTMSPFEQGHNSKKTGKLCNCQGVCSPSKHWVHSKAGSNVAERELVEFLTEEILAERKAQKSKTLPTELAGFKVQLNGAEVVLTKQVQDETIKIRFNVNNSVDTDPIPEINPNADQPELGELKSKPDFNVQIKRGNTTLSLHCSYINPDQREEGFNDHFGIDELSVFDGEETDNTYAVAGEVLDSYLYDLLLNYLEEKGISNEFVDQMSDYSTIYEHSAYIGLLEGLSKFASGK